jgi:hypothetical protein
MKILAIEQVLPASSEQAFLQYAKPEAKKVWELLQAGWIREIYFRADRPEAVLMLECSSIKEAGGILEQLPYVEQGLIRFELIPLKAYPGFERLFAGNQLP